MNKIKFLILTIHIFGLSQLAVAQDDLLQLLEDERPKSLLYTMATFKTNRIAIGHSIETRKKGILQLHLGTRYWNIPLEGRRTSFLVDRVSVRFGAEYAFTDLFTGELGINSFDGVINSSLKYRVLRQQDNGKVPLGITLVQSTSLFTRNFSGVQLPGSFSERLLFTQQAIFARKFNRNLSLQIAPTYIHSNSQQLNFEEKDFFVLGLGGRYRIGNHTELVSEYHFVAGREEGVQGFNPYSFGLNWEIGDTTMQFFLTNAKSFDEATTILYTPNNFNFNDGGLHLGVNVIYVLHLKKRELPK